MGFSNRFAKPGANMSNYNTPRPTGSVIGPPRKQGEEKKDNQMSMASSLEGFKPTLGKKIGLGAIGIKK